MTGISKFFYNDNDFISYSIRSSVKNKNFPYIVFLHGFRSDMSGDKVIAIEQLAEEHDLNFIKFDCRNHGVSSGLKEEGKFSDWLQDIEIILTKIMPENAKAILLGSSMGSWLSVVTAVRLPQKIHSLILLAAAPDFSKRLMWNNFTEQQKSDLEKNGFIKLPSKNCDFEYHVTKELIEDGKKIEVLNDKIDINVPVSLIHGTNDETVGYEYSLKLLELINSENIKMHLIKNADHRLSKKEDIDFIILTVKNHLNII